MTRRPLRAATWLLVCTGVVGALVWMTGAPAAAHASLLSSDPEEGSVVAAVPETVVLTFNEPIRMSDDGVTGYTPEGDEWTVDATASGDKVVVTPADDPGTGTVLIAWAVVSEDGHEVRGALSFSIGQVSAGGALPGSASGDPRTSVTVARGVLAVVAGLGLLISLGLALARRDAAAGLAWNVGLAGAVLLGPVHDLALDGRGLRGLGDWLTWVSGLTRTSSLLLLGAFLVAAIVRHRPPRLVAAAAVPALLLLVLAGTTWPAAPERAEATSEPAGPSEPMTVSGDLAGAGTVELKVVPLGGRDVRLELLLRRADGEPLQPFAPPTLEVLNDRISLGEVALEVDAGSYSTQVTIPFEGDWSAQVSVRLDEFDNPVVVLPFSVT